MTHEEGLNEGLAAEAEAMLRDGTLEGLVRRLRRDFPALASEADAAVGHGVARLIVRSQAPDDPRGYLAASAYNEMKRIGRQKARCGSLEALAVDQDDRPGWEPAQGGWTVEEQTLLRATYDLLCAHVAIWDTENVRVVTLLFLEAAFLGEPLPSAAAAELASGLLGYEVDASFVRTWKSRGFRKLRDFIATIDAVDAQREESLR
jgi:hypothetical protein